ncbi:MAG: DUF6261 family protein [Verrucomicrobiales bacterium]|jgi:hypothetical protein|nr:DUF6261 family protein [Verrucomicrobiales bacterium]
MKIINPAFYRYQALETTEYIKEFYDLVKSVGADAQHANVLTLFNELTPLCKLLFTIAYSSRELPLTKELKALDLARDRAYSGVRSCVAKLQYYYKPAVQQAAAQLAAIFKRYPRANSQNYDAETSDITEVSDALLTADNLAALRAIDEGHDLFVAWVKELVDRNNDFRKKMEQRYEEQAAQTDTPNIIRTRAAAVVLVKKILERIGGSTNAGLNPDLFPKLQEALNIMAQKYNTRAKERLARQNPEKTS